MPRPLAWTEAQDADIRRLRAEGGSWDSIAAAIGVSRWAAFERGRAVGARFPRAVKAEIDALAAELADPARLPLAAGHPASWGLIAGGAPYPWPPLATVRP
jgi:hypothetical protein